MLRARCTGISLYLYAVIHRGTLYLRISQQILPTGLNRVSSLPWPAFMQIYWNKRKPLHKKRVQLSEDMVWDTNMAAVSLFWGTNMAAVASCENTIVK